jgi:putative Holliday junction resolvase
LCGNGKQKQNVRNNRRTLTIIVNCRDLDYSSYVGKKRVLCVDYGEKRIGLAISDINWRIASPLRYLDNRGVYPSLFCVIEKQDIGVVIVGAPIALNGGNSGKQFEKIKTFTERFSELSATGTFDIKILYWDERLSTVAANKILTEAKMTIANKRKNIDKVAASFILQGFLDYVEHYLKLNRNV